MPLPGWLNDGRIVAVSVAEKISELQQLPTEVLKGGSRFYDPYIRKESSPEGPCVVAQLVDMRSLSYGNPHLLLDQPCGTSALGA